MPYDETERNEGHNRRPNNVIIYSASSLCITVYGTEVSKLKLRRCISRGFPFVGQSCKILWDTVFYSMLYSLEKHERNTFILKI